LEKGTFLIVQATLFFFALTKAKVWERYGKVWAIYDPYVGMIWDSIDIMWDWYGV
jgi:molybdopterin/thiamine biosynthesis adenylyltransferase